jgi:hypothetical protein
MNILAVATRGPQGGFEGASNDYEQIKDYDARKICNSAGAARLLARDASRGSPACGLYDFRPADLQRWTRDVALDPDWRRGGTDIVGSVGNPATISPFDWPSRSPDRPAIPK